MAPSLTIVGASFTAATVKFIAAGTTLVPSLTLNESAKSPLKFAAGVIV